MKVVILAGGLGTRIMEETESKPKPMVEIGGKPILWHIMKQYSFHGINEFIICCGYKGYLIKEYFHNYSLHLSDVKINLKNNKVEVKRRNLEPWEITLVDTGQSTMTGGRLKRIKELIGEEDFCMTYGDGVSDVNISNLIDFHKKHGLNATLTAVRPPGRFGILEIDNNNYLVKAFKEKPQGDGDWINGGFFVLKPAVFNLIENDTTVWEQEPLMQLAKTSNLTHFKHFGFWHPMDTLRDCRYLQSLWENGKAPWKIWK